ncbi:IS1414, transposase, truncation [Escherichia coli]|nr:IS1414, transposase, truncation [Escherichia coli]
MDKKQLQALANELAKNNKTPEDLSQFDRLTRPGTNSRNGPQRPLSQARDLWNC